MANENQYCTCTTPEITIKLNKQGPQGLVGPQGNPGFSPVITVEEDTSTNYKLNIQTEQGSFITPNLKGSIPAGGSTGSVLTRTESGDAEFAPIPYATASNAGIVVFATQEDIEDGETGLAVTSDVVRNYYTKTQADDKYVDLTSQQDVTGRKIFSDLRTNSIAEPNGNTYISYHRDGADSSLNSVTLGGINTPNVYINRDGGVYTNIDTGNIGTNLPTATNNSLGVVKPDGTTITIDATGTLSSLGSTPSNMVTTDTTQTITSSKSFSGSEISFNNNVTLNTSSVATSTNNFLLSAYLCAEDSNNFKSSGFDRILTYRNVPNSTQKILEVGSTGKATISNVPCWYAGKLRLDAPEILTRYDGTNEYEVLDENNITTNTTITELTSRITALENTITDLQNRITSLETEINGGNA